MAKRLTCVGGFGTFRETASFTADDADEIVAAAGGHSITLVACRDAGVVGYGTAFHGELGPNRLALRLTTLSIVRIACGGSFVVAASSDGACYEWGHGSTEPKKLPEVSGVVEVAAGDGHALARTTDSVVFSWGNNQYGQCGVGVRSPRVASPTVLAERWKYVAAGAQHSAMIATNGDLYTFGWGQYHQLGLGSTADQPRPTCVTSLQGVGDYVRGVFAGVRQVACGAWHTVALTTTGDMYTWGGASMASSYAANECLHELTMGF
ncbi:hypothetical protein SPRG_04177 [Saprolegnia parasitica CBS 223.65]|uniref:Uncharacterized protein n=1 Tax=Saprolegnia parasitica (strain CBS 223.65) TaxID=695850 RepID=A0A067CJR7_SAPPC|nr:hypothetical protein SPRG_04177 [Saprolegnia parasitica CBS 223.65]KDO30989.1 hypothetical protein SPRG_04177 [Saprolegnia parasitica CBS 223.65]|eukprot:XP_012198173.1 hypothetical protein SPRG_04177 [Saprolegnia parasitica CBS 223.65]